LAVKSSGFVVKKVVGSRPVTVAKDEVLSTLHVGKQHIELDMDVSQTYIAQKVCSVLQGFAPGLVIDLGFVLEGRGGEADDVTMAGGGRDGSAAPMLPERLLCTARLNRVDLEVLPRA
jgi:hypothetical protein